MIPAYRKVPPPQCLKDCTRNGDVDAVVADWQKRLGYNVPRWYAMPKLRQYWHVTNDLIWASDQDLSERYLWITCCEIMRGKQSR